MPGKSAEAIWKLEFGASVRNGGQTEFRVRAPKVNSVAVRILGGQPRTIPMTCDFALAAARRTWSVPHRRSRFVRLVRSRLGWYRAQRLHHLRTAHRHVHGRGN